MPNSTEQSSSGVDDSHSTGQEIPHLLKNMKRVTTMHVAAKQWALSWARRIQSTPSNPTEVQHIVCQIKKPNSSGIARFFGHQVWVIAMTAPKMN